jgi:hypothetical protein
MLEAMADPEIPFIGYESEQDWFHALCNVPFGTFCGE